MSLEDILRRTRLREQVLEAVPPAAYGSCVNEEGGMAMGDLLERVQRMPMAKEWGACS